MVLSCRENYWLNLATAVYQYQWVLQVDFRTKHIWDWKQITKYNTYPDAQNAALSQLKWPQIHNKQRKVELFDSSVPSWTKMCRVTVGTTTFSNWQQTSVLSLFQSNSLLIKPHSMKISKHTYALWVLLFPSPSKNCTEYWCQKISSSINT